MVGPISGFLGEFVPGGIDRGTTLLTAPPGNSSE